MGALMAALVAALVVQATDRTPWLASILAERCGRPATVILAAALAIAIGNGIAAIGGALMTELMPPRARTLFLALAFGFAGGAALVPLRPPDRLTTWRIGATATAFFGILILGFGDRTQFLTAAFAVNSTTPALAAVGATIGSVVALAAWVMLGERARKRLPVGAIRTVSGIALLAVAAFLALSVFRLI